MSNKEIIKRGLIRTGNYLPYNPNLTERAKDLRNNMTTEEEKLWINFLKNHEYRFRAQKQIENYIVDFYCAKAKLVIEIDGNIHYDENNIVYDKERTKLFESYGIKVIRFKNEEISNDFNKVCIKINKVIFDL